MANGGDGALRWFQNDWVKILALIVSMGVAVWRIGNWQGQTIAQLSAVVAAVHNLELATKELVVTQTAASLDRREHTVAIHDLQRRVQKLEDQHFK